jgi:hypothetical protein
MGESWNGPLMTPLLVCQTEMETNPILIFFVDVSTIRVKFDYPVDLRGTPQQGWQETHNKKRKFRSSLESVFSLPDLSFLDVHHCGPAISKYIPAPALGKIGMSRDHFDTIMKNICFSK